MLNSTDQASVISSVISKTFTMPMVTKFDHGAEPNGTSYNYRATLEVKPGDMIRSTKEGLINLYQKTVQANCSCLMTSQIMAPGRRSE